MALLSIQSPGCLKIQDGERVFEGADQEWYSKTWQRRAGCGPTVASMIAWYLSKTRPGCRALSENPDNSKESMLKLMDDVWEYVTPGYRGVNSTGILVKGFKDYANSKGISLRINFLDIGLDKSRRQDYSEIAGFISSAIENDCPVAFLNLHNGEEKVLDRWHWVLLVSFCSGTGKAVIIDQGKSFEIDILLWLSTTILGGGFVYADII